MLNRENQKSDVINHFYAVYKRHEIIVFVEVIHLSLGQISQPHLFKMLSTVPEVGVWLY